MDVFYAHRGLLSDCQAFLALAADPAPAQVLACSRNVEVAPEGTEAAACPVRRLRPVSANRLERFRPAIDF
jgi:hypothetical protein